MKTNALILKKNLQLSSFFTIDSYKKTEAKHAKTQQKTNQMKRDINKSDCGK